ncbi:MAG: DUF2330 domain-containing protein [bacterium]|nr:DUF2330 domain-containing protein [bacterium]
MKKIILCFIFLGNLVFADKGMFSVMPNISIYEPGQKAIIAWNGKKECLILAVDAYADTNTKVIEILPLPSEPEVKEGKIESFKEVQRLIMKYRPTPKTKGIKSEGSPAVPREEGVEILFHKQIGAHNITCVKALNIKEFQKWAQEFIKSENMDSISAPPRLGSIISHYMEDSIVYFVFDVIELNKEISSINPIIYEFKSPYLFFPLIISSLTKGESEIQLFLLTKDAPWPLAVSPFKIGEYRTYRRNTVANIQFNITYEELGLIDPILRKYFKNKVWLTALEHKETMSNLNKDLKLKTFCKIIEY